MARLLLIDVVKNEIKEVHINGGDIHWYHEYIDCRCFDITQRKIGGRYFDIFCDDEGLLKDPQPPLSAINTKTKEPMLVGNLIIANHDRAGETTDLSDEDIKLIKKHIVMLTMKDGSMNLALDCEY